MQCGLLVGIMEARKPDRQGSLASLLASSLPHFISYCYVAAWLGLLVCVCLQGCGSGSRRWWRPYRPVKATHTGCCICPLFQKRILSTALGQLTDQLDTFKHYVQNPQLLFPPFFSAVLSILFTLNRLENEFINEIDWQTDRKYQIFSCFLFHKCEYLLVLS